MIYLLYRGPSLFDKKPIIVLATCVDKPSANAKTGPMVQTFILREDISPVDACKEGEDFSVCGDCKLRGRTEKERACYVNIYQSVAGVWKAFMRGNYKIVPDDEQADFFAGKLIRMGAYGDPGAAPVEMWQNVTRKAKGFTGYSHAWKYINSALSTLCMASADTEAEAIQAQSMGWRTYRIIAEDEARKKTEALCPAAKEAKKPITCSECLMCCGTDRNSNGNIAIPVHGQKHKVIAFVNARELDRQAA